MEEKIISGYCRCLDQSRMVTLELDGDSPEIDCAYFSCIHQNSCAIAQQIDEFLKK